MINQKVSIKKLTQTRQNIYLLKINWKKLQTFELIYFRSKSHFDEDGTQNYLVFQPVCRYIKRVVNFGCTLEWKCKGLSDEIIKSLSALRIFLNLSLNYLGTEIRVGYNGSCLK